jgi:hypothetical protein
MALIQGIHCLAHGNKSEARRIAEDIRRHQRLFVGSGTWSGAGAYAWYAEYFPGHLRDWPQVWFLVDDQRIKPLRIRLPDGTWRQYFLIPGVIGEYVSIQVITFVNLD